MQKIKTALVRVWDMLLDGIDAVTGWIERHPRATFWLVLAYLVVRR